MEALAIPGSSPARDRRFLGLRKPSTALHVARQLSFEYSNAFRLETAGCLGDESMSGEEAH